MGDPSVMKEKVTSSWNGATTISGSGRLPAAAPQSIACLPIFLPRPASQGGRKNHVRYRIHNHPLRKRRPQAVGLDLSTSNRHSSTHIKCPVE